MPDTTKQNATSWRLTIGFCLFGISIIIPLAGIPLVALLNLSTAAAASISGAFLIGSEVLGLISVAVMGKEGYEVVKNRLLAHLKALTPDRPIGRKRYNWGLVLFSVPLIFGWLSVYVADLIPYFSDYAIYYAIGGDTMMIVSLLVLGGDFWQKIRALFIYDMNVSSSFQGGTHN